MVGDSLDPLVAWLEHELANDDQYGSKSDKLDASGCDERHLVLRVDLGNRIPNDVAMVLVELDAELPTRAPSIPGRFVTGLMAAARVLRVRACVDRG